MTLSNAILNRKCFLRKDRDILNAVWEIITECPITRAGEGEREKERKRPHLLQNHKGGGRGINITPFETRAGSLPALLFCHTVILSLCTPGALSV